MAGRKYSNQTGKRRSPSVGSGIASVVDAVGTTVGAGVMLVPDVIIGGAIPGAKKYGTRMKAINERIEKRFRDSQANYPKRKRAKSKTKAVNTRLGGS